MNSHIKARVRRESPFLHHMKLHGRASDPSGIGHSSLS